MIPFGEVVTISASQVDTPLIGKPLATSWRIEAKFLFNNLDNFKTDMEISALNGTSDRDLKVTI